MNAAQKTAKQQFSTVFFEVTWRKTKNKNNF
jgi:hypothetical protein